MVTTLELPQGILLNQQQNNHSINSLMYLFTYTYYTRMYIKASNTQ